jgi:hypothetical protein
MALLKGRTQWLLITAAVLLASGCTPSQQGSQPRMNWEQLTASSAAARTSNIQSLIQPGMY